MTDETNRANLRAFSPDRAAFQTRVRDLAAESCNVLQKSGHARDRQEERGIYDWMLFDVLRTGFLEGPIVAGENPGEWKFEMTKRVKGKREVGVVSVLMRETKIFVVTAMWKDM